MDKVQQKAEAMKETRDGSHKMVNVVRTGKLLEHIEHIFGYG